MCFFFPSFCKTRPVTIFKNIGCYQARGSSNIAWRCCHTPKKLTTSSKTLWRCSRAHLNMWMLSTWMLWWALIITTPKLGMVWRVVEYLQKIMQGGSLGVKDDWGFYYKNKRIGYPYSPHWCPSVLLRNRGTFCTLWEEALGLPYIRTFGHVVWSRCH